MNVPSDAGEAWSLVPMEERTVHHRRRPLPPLPTEAQLLAATLEHLQDLGALGERNDDPLRLTQGRSSPVEQLSRLLQELVPMIESFRQPSSRRQSWWRRFTGEALERELMYLHACQALEGKASEAERLAAEVQGLRRELAHEAGSTLRQSRWLAELVATGHAVLAPNHAAARAQACFADQPDYWARFARRIDNLNALQHALTLSARQFELADAHAQAVLDRHADIVTVLVPLWRQRMGLELFAKSVAPLPHSTRSS